MEEGELVAGGERRRPMRPRRVEQRERDLLDIANMYLRGWKQAEILEWLNANRDYRLAPSTLGVDITELHKRWMVTHIADFDSAKAKELERIDILERAYWEGYERSMKPYNEDYVEQVRDEQRGLGGKEEEEEEEGEVGERVVGGNVYTRTKTKHKRTERTGSVSFLQGVERCINLRCQILGLNAPLQLNINWRKDAKQAGIDPDEMKRNLIRQYVGKAKANLLDAARLANEVSEGGEIVEGVARDLDDE